MVKFDPYMARSRSLEAYIERMMPIPPDIESTVKAYNGILVALAHMRVIEIPNNNRWQPDPELSYLTSFLVNPTLKPQRRLATMYNFFGQKPNKRYVIASFPRNITLEQLNECLPQKPLDITNQGVPAILIRRHMEAYGINPPSRNQTVIFSY